MPRSRFGSADVLTDKELPRPEDADEVRYVAKRFIASSIGTLLFLAALVLPRVLFLDADAHPDLCWGTGIWTDEGYYNHNARNAVLFGQARLDEFNNANLSPILDALQRSVFSLFGVGLVPARALSVLFGLLSLVFFYDGLRRRLGWRVALTATVFLGLDPLYLFYNRLAMMESPAVCVACMALWAWCIGGRTMLSLSGLLAASLIAWKTSFLLLAPLPALVALWQGPRDAVRACAPYLLGIALALSIYFFAWFRPHQAEIVHMNRHYAMEQARPKSLVQAGWMVRRAWVGYQNGLMNRLFTRSPILALLTLLGLCCPPRRNIVRLVYLWTALGIVWISVSKYAPTRYYLVFWPGLCALAAHTLWRLPALLQRRSGKVGLAIGTLLLGLHGTQPMVFALGKKDWGLPVGLLIGALLASGALRLPIPRSSRLLPAALVAFLAIALGQTFTYFATRGYRTREISRELARLGGADAVVLGDWAPAFSLNTRLKMIPVFKKLANDTHPVERLGADYILASRDRVHRELWIRLAPTTYRPENRIAVFPFYQHTLELYRVPKPMEGR